MAKRILVLLIVVMFTFAVVSLGFAAEVKGTVAKIDGKKITVKDAAGKETAVEVKEVPKGLKVGDKVTIKDGVVTIEKKPAAGGY